MQLTITFAQDNPEVEFADDNLRLGLPNQWIAGTGSENWPLSPETGRSASSRGLQLWRSDDRLCGYGEIDLSEQTIREASKLLYQEIFQVCQGLHVHRIWNFIPRINQADGEYDQYMEFCVGRGDAFIAQGLEKMPAASAVGTLGNKLRILFIAGTESAQPIENPLQIPAYRYPSRYGPNPPNFARAGVVSGTNGGLYISGTASIRQSESLHVGHIEPQLHLALDNMRRVAAEADYADAMSAQGDGQRIIRVYLRDPALWPELEKIVGRELLRSTDQFNVVQANLCRPELLIELEAFIAPTK